MLDVGILQACSSSAIFARIEQCLTLHCADEAFGTGPKQVLQDGLFVLSRERLGLCLCQCRVPTQKEADRLERSFSSSAVFPRDTI